MKIKTSKYRIAMAFLILVMCMISAIVVVWVESKEEGHHRFRYDGEIDFVVSRDETHYRISILETQDPNGVLRFRRLFVHILNTSTEYVYNLNEITYIEDPDETDLEWFTKYNSIIANITLLDNDNDGRLSKDDELLINEDFVNLGWEISCWYFDNREILNYVFI